MKHASLPLLKRREFITLLSGAVAAYAQQDERARQNDMPLLFLARTHEVIE
jgi:hypothetical protein